MDVATPLLQIRGVEKAFGAQVTAAGVNLDIENGEFFTMLGPSGSGKSTILRMIAGLETPDKGRILIDGRDVTDLPPWRRGLGMVFQQYANFPHMTVAENIAYGLRRGKLSRAETQKRVAELLELVSLPGFGGRSVTRLSGGEQQRVAIARALAPKPRLLLLDEPLSALDEKIRREMQTQLKDIQRATMTTFVYVTHDQEEALTMSDRVAVLNRGRLVQVDEPQRLFRRPRTRFVAGFFRGSNVVSGTLINGPHGTLFQCASFQVELPAAPADAADPPSVAIRAEDIRIDGAANSDDLTFEATLDRVIYRGVYTDYQVRLADGQVIVASSTGAREVALGKTVRLAIRSDLVTPLGAEPTEWRSK